MTDREIMQQALEALEGSDESGCDEFLSIIDALEARLAQPDAYGYASRLAVAIWEQHYKDVAPQWKPLDDLMGVLTQIDNMTSGLTRLAQPEQEPVAWGWAIMHSDGTYARIRPRIADFFGSIQERDPYTSDDAKHADREWAGLAPHTIVTLHTSTPQRKPLTDERIGQIIEDCKITLVNYCSDDKQIEFARAIEVAHGIKENT